MGKIIEIDADFFAQLLKCLSEQKYLHLQPAEIVIERQAAIDQVHHEGIDLLAALQSKRFSEEILQKCQDRITKDIVLIGTVIKSKSSDPKILTEYVFKWGLVRQECEMYCLIGEEVELEEFNLLCERCGFDKDMKEYIRGMMGHVGLGGQLKQEIEVL